MIRGEPVAPMTPWYRNFKGSVEMAEDSKSFVVTGALDVSGLRVTVTELPIGLWTDTFKALLDESPLVSSYQNRSTEVDVHFVVDFKPEAEGLLSDAKALEKHLKMSKKLHLTNMHLFDPKGVIKRYDDVEHILQEFFPVRMEMYARRKKWLLEKTDSELESLQNRLRFVLGVVDSRIRILKAPEDDTAEDLRALGIDERYWKALMDMPVRSLTRAKVEALRNEEEALRKKRDALQALGPKDMWLSDLSALNEALDVSQ